MQQKKNTDSTFSASKQNLYANFSIWLQNKANTVTDTLKITSKILIRVKLKTKQKRIDSVFWS